MVCVIDGQRLPQKVVCGVPRNAYVRLSHQHALKDVPAAHQLTPGGRGEFGTWGDGAVDGHPSSVLDVVPAGLAQQTVAFPASSSSAYRYN